MSAAVPWRADARPAGLVALGHAVSHFYQLAFAPLFPIWRDVFGLSWTELGLIMTVFYSVSCLGQAAAGFLVDQHGPRRALIAGLLLMSGGSVIAALAGGYAGLLVAAGVAALGNAVFHPADFALLNDRVSERRISHAYSLHGISGTLGFASAPVVMASLAQAFGWREALAIASMVGVVMAMVVWVCRADFSTVPVPRPLPGTPSAGTFAFFNRALAYSMVFFITVNIAGIGVQNMGASLLVDLGRMDALSAASWLTIYIVCVGVGMLTGGFIASGNPRSERITGAGTLAAAGLLLLLVWLPNLGSLATGLLLGAAGFALGCVQPARDMLVRSAVSRATAGRAYGIVYAAVDVGAALGPAVMGWWLDRHQAASGFMTAALFLGLTAVAGVLISREVRRLKANAALSSGVVI